MKIKIKKYIEFFLLFLLLLDVGSVPSVFFSGGKFCIFIIIISFLYCIIYRRGISKVQLRLLAGFCVFFILSSLFTSTSLILYFGLIIRVIAVIFIFSVFRNRLDLLLETLTDVLKFIAYLGAINYILINFFPFLFSARVAEGGFSVSTFIYLFNYNSFINIGPLSLLRNQGMFWEPGVFQISMNLLLYILIIVKQKSLLQAILPIFLIISSFSTTGLVVMSFIILYRFIVDKKTLARGDKLVILIATILLTPLVLGNINQKFTGDSKESAALRTFDLYMGVDMILNNPIWGAGPDPEKYLSLTKDISTGYYDIDIDHERGNTNTIISFMCYLGIPFSVYFFRMIYLQNLFPRRKMFFLIFIIMFASEPLFGTAILFLLSMSSKAIVR